MTTELANECKVNGYNRSTFNQIMIEHNGRTLSIVQHYTTTVSNHGVLSCSEIMDMSTQRIERFDGTGHSLIEAIEAFDKSCPIEDGEYEEGEV